MPFGNPDDIYYSQREELKGLLQSLASSHESLIVRDEVLLRPDDIHRLLEKLKNQNHLSRKERHAVTEAGFDLSQIYPGL